MQGNHSPSSSGYRLEETPEGHKEIIPKPNQSELQEYYHNKYYQEGLGSYEISYTPSELSYIENRLNCLRSLLQSYLQTESKPVLLDIGCGEGFASAYFARNGYSVNSIDYSSAGVSRHNPELHSVHEVGDIFSSLEHKASEDLKFDVLLLQNVLEHVIDPRKLCEIMKNLLRGNGVAIITIPNDFSITQLTAIKEQCISNEFWVCPPDHLSYFNTKTAQHFLRSQGWDVLDMISDFPVDFYLFHDGSNYIADKSKGKSAHQARILIENMLHTAPVDDVVGFYRAAAKIGIGRNITLVARPNF